MTQYHGDPWEEGLRQMLASIRMPQMQVDLETWMAEHESFKPSWGQQKVVDAIKGGAREIGIVAPPRSGKSQIARIIGKYRVLTRADRCWVLGPTWDDVDRTLMPMWDSFEREAARKDTIITGRNKVSRKIDTAGGGFLEGVSWTVLSQIEAQGIDMAIVDEAQYLTDTTLNKIRDRLEGDYLLIMSGRPEATGGSYYEELMLQYAQDQRPGFVGPISWPTWANPDPKIRRKVQIELEILRHERKAHGKDSPEYKRLYRNFLVSYAGVSLPPSDIAISTFDPQVHVRECPYDEDLPVYLAIDPGFYPSHYAVLALQPHPYGSMLKIDSKKGERQDELWQIDEVYVQRTITDDVIDLCMHKPWWNRVEKAVIDVAARQSNRQTGSSDLAVWQKRTSFPVTADFVTIDDGLNVHRTWLSDNRLFHDREHCPSTIREYSLYKMRARKPGDAKDIPIDANNHALKALAYLLVNTFGVTNSVRKPAQWTRQIKRPIRRRYV